MLLQIMIELYRKKKYYSPSPDIALLRTYYMYIVYILFTDANTNFSLLRPI